jgi:hemerythrin-like metal-binding protein
MQEVPEQGFETGAARVDAEHHLQMRLLGALEDAVSRGVDPELARRTMAELAELSSAHFRSEELLMRLDAYPELEAHAREHARLTDGLQRLREELQAGPAPRTAQSVAAFRASLDGHVRSMDQGFARWCLAAAARGVGAL